MSLNPVGDNAMRWYKDLTKIAVPPKQEQYVSAYINSWSAVTWRALCPAHYVYCASYLARLDQVCRLSICDPCVWAPRMSL